MPRRTVSLPKTIDDLVHELAEQGESYSAAVARLIQDGARSTRSEPRPRYVGSAHSGPPRDFARNYERYVEDALASVDRQPR